jgi:hypothetical protein
MSTAKDIRRLALRTDQVLEIHLSDWPSPPPALLKIPGVVDWWNQMKLSRERDVLAIQRLVNNLNQSQRVVE